MEPERRTTHTHIERERSGSGLAFIVGGLVVAVLVLAYFMFGGEDPWIGGGADTAVNVEASTGATAGAEAPATEAPAEGGAAATGSATTDSETTGAAATGTATTEPAQN